jgi:hypothetical protein
VNDCAHVQPQDDPPTVLTGVIEAIGPPGENSLLPELLAHARDLIAPPRDSAGPAASDDLLLAAALMLAAILAVTGPTPQEELDDAHVVMLQGVLATLIALTVPEYENQAVLLARA